MSSHIYNWLQLTISAFGVVAILLLLLLIAFLLILKRQKCQKSVEIQVKSLNKQYENYKSKIFDETLSEDELKELEKADKKLQKDKKEMLKKMSEKPKRVFVLDFCGDIHASQVTQFREQVSAIVQTARPIDEVIVRLESPGGVVHGYGLAASQLARIRNKKIPLTICVDKVAASGGYMMACLANKIVAAPFAIVGSIGVIASMPNFNKLLTKNEVDYLEITAGEYKRTITPLGQITEKGKAKFQEQIEETHELFKTHINTHRPNVDLEKVATGEYWYATQALELNLVDEIKTSDDCILDACKEFDVYQILTPKKETFKDKLTASVQSVFNLIINNKLEQNSEKYPFLM